MNDLRINGARMLKDLELLGLIGASGSGGVTRLALSHEDRLARAWFRRRVEAAGLRFEEDGAGNQSAILPAGNPGVKTLLIGSHLDTVPEGGRFDGALGVLAALETARTIGEAGLTLPFHLEVINFTDEEGTNLGELGSQAVAGTLTREQLSRPRGGTGRLAAGLAGLGLTEASILSSGRDPAAYRGYLELHIEQGTRLEESGVAIGVVSGIVGIRSCWLYFKGEAAHAGTMPLERRRDALWAAAQFIHDVRRVTAGRFTPGVFNCGIVAASPGAFNIVPAEVRLALEFRHGSEDILDDMEHVFFSLARQIAAGLDLEIEIAPLDVVPAAPSAEEIMAAVETASGRLGLQSTRLLSFAGHDAQALSGFTPCGMIFVPSVGGISHNPAEYTRPEDCVNGANTLLHAVLTLAFPGES